MTQLTRHPLSTAFGNMAPERRAELRASIEKIGVKLPITLYEGMVLDGWHRYVEATDLEVACPKEQLGKSEDPREFVAAMNLPRRDYTDSQRALITVRLNDWRPVGKPAVPNPAESAELAPKTTAQLAESAGVGARTIERAKVVETTGSEALKRAVMEGAVSVTKAAEVAQLPKREQLAAATAPPPPAPKKEKAPTYPDLTGRVAELEEQVEQLSTVNREVMGDNESMLKILEADDRLKAAMTEAKRFRDNFHAMEDRLRGMQNEKNELIRTVKSLEKRLAVAK